MTANLGAILTAMVTPFDDQGRLDEEAAVRLMQHLVEHGSDGLVLCGTTGEAATMTDEEHLRVIELGVRMKSPILTARSWPEWAPTTRVTRCI